MGFLKLFLIVCFGFITPLIGMAQQDPMYSMYMFDKMLINPAFAGSSNWAVTTLKYREQFSGFVGHPSTQTLNFHAPIQKKHLGVGVKLINDKIAVLSNLNIAGLLSYHLNFAGGKLSLGIEAGVFNRKINYQKLILSTKGDNVVPLTDRSSLVPDFSYGFYYQKRQFYLGVSHYHLLGANFNYKSSVRSSSQLYKHFYIIAGNVFSINKKLTIEPSVLLKYQAASSIQFDFNTTFYYNDLIGVGVQYRSSDAIVGLVRINVTENFKIAYSYDFTVSQLSPYSNGAHEIVISYGIKLPPPPSKKEIHPRYYF